MSVIDARHHPELVAWPPLMDWCRKHEIDPDRCYRLAYGEGVVRAEMYVPKEGGFVVFDEDGEYVTESIVRRYVEPPPMRIEQQED